MVQSSATYPQLVNALAEYLEDEYFEAGRASDIDYLEHAQTMPWLRERHAQRAAARVTRPNRAAR